MNYNPAHLETVATRHDTSTEAVETALDTYDTVATEMPWMPAFPIVAQRLETDEDLIADLVCDYMALSAGLTS